MAAHAPTLPSHAQRRVTTVLRLAASHDTPLTSLCPWIGTCQRLCDALPSAASLLAPWVAFAVVWSVGATCDSASRRRFSEWMRSTMAREGHGPAFPDKGLVYDYR